MKNATQGYALSLALIMGAPQVPCVPGTTDEAQDSASSSTDAPPPTTDPNSAADLASSEASPDLTVDQLPPSTTPPTPPVPSDFDAGVTLRLTEVAPGSQRVSFGLPLPRGAVADPRTLIARIAGVAIAAQFTELLPELDAQGARVGARAVRVQLDPSLLSPSGTDVTIAWLGGATATTDTTAPIAFGTEEVSFASASIVPTATRTIAPLSSTTGGYALVEGATVDKVVFVGREPRVLPTYPDGYLGHTGILGHILSKSDVAKRPALQGVGFLSTQLEAVLRSAMYDEPYKINPDADSLPDFGVSYEAWLYDRCATFLIGYAHVGDTKFLRHALRTCSYYGSRIELTGANRGIFLGKPDPDIKYSHLRGLYAYYALTGDERALQSLEAMAEMWLAEPLFVAPYRQGKLRGLDKLWTERLLGTSLEALLYGHRLKGEAKYLTGFKELLTTAYKHITGDQQALDELNPGAGFPPQNCFIHSAAQHGEGDVSEPWCSSWMSELSLDTLLQWHEVSSDARVPEIVARLGRFLRDTGSNYFRGNPLGDSFLAPSICYVAGDENPRWLLPLYGAGLNQSGQRDTSGEYDDFEHCTDATALLAAARWALASGIPEAAAPAPFVDEQQSFEALHQEFLACASGTFDAESRPRRNPLVWTSAQLAAGAADPTAFITAQKIGYPQHQLAPLRKIGWWFNMAALQFALLTEAGIAVPTVKAGWVQPSGCP